MLSEAYHLLVLLGTLTLLIWLVVRGLNVLAAAPLCAALAILCSGHDPLVGLSGSYMTGLADYLRRFYLIFTLGAVFGRVMSVSQAGVQVAELICRGLGRERACLAVVLACAVLSLGGVSLFVVGFTVVPLAIPLFRAADLPRRFIPAAVAFGSVTFTMTAAGSPAIQNLIPIQYFVDAVTAQPLTDARAGWPVSLLVAVAMFVVGQWYLDRAIRLDRQRGAKFESRPGDPLSTPTEHSAESHSPRPSPPPRPGSLRSLLPLLMTVFALNLLPGLCRRVAAILPSEGSLQPVQAMLRWVPEDGVFAIFVGLIAAILLLRPWIPDLGHAVGEGFAQGLLAVGSTSAMVGFGAAIQKLHGFQLVVDWVTHLPGHPLLTAALAVALIAGIAGTASGGQGIALPILKPICIDQMHVSARALHRVVSLSSGTLDTLPANGYLVVLIRHLCGETHGSAYWPIFITTVIVPTGGTLLAVLLFWLFPGWAG